MSIQSYPCGGATWFVDFVDFLSRTRFDHIVINVKISVFLNVWIFTELNETTACQFVDPADDCTFYYLYYYDEATDNATVWVREHKDCPPPVPVLAIVLGVIAGIVILGLILLLVWKLLTVLHDRAEYAKFNNERLMAKWDTVCAQISFCLLFPINSHADFFTKKCLFLFQNENPIYKQATTTFRNPVYAGNKNKGL
ncbi:integrin beta cytoplasmic domain protein [Ancylostoma duodenale]|uniref:Integrin beta cytoplasmic domain protein n=1 Tax=Ancylostoma duodenale TaxID=51022 RepID=A0A0C2C796_9BILA|nr:integrin beta cytoplasmic domain protein [Ancylostoma duodenale]